VAIVDDVLSTGGTMLALIQALEHVGAEIADICVAIRRGKADVGRPVKSLVDIEVARGKVRIVGRSL
jgi:adenine phosphoribosyltransferase